MSQTADLDARSIIGQPVPPLYTSLDKAELGAIHRACESGGRPGRMRVELKA
jgi:hypothetical protein